VVLVVETQQNVHFPRHLVSLLHGSGGHIYIVYLTGSVHAYHRRRVFKFSFGVFHSHLEVIGHKTYICLTSRFVVLLKRVEEVQEVVFMKEYSDLSSSKGSEFAKDSVSIIFSITTYKADVGNVSYKHIHFFTIMEGSFVLGQIIILTTDTQFPHSVHIWKTLANWIHCFVHAEITVAWILVHLLKGVGVSASHFWVFNIGSELLLKLNKLTNTMIF